MPTAKVEAYRHQVFSMAERMVLMVSLLEYKG